MFGSVFDKATGLLEKRFVLGLLLPCLSFAAAVSALVVTARGWASALTWWHGLSAGQQWLIAGGSVVVLAFAASVLGAQLGALTRLWEGYWPGSRAVRAGRWVQARRWNRLDLSDPADYSRRYHEFPARTDQLLPTRLGNALRAAESYAGDSERYGADAVFFWPRLYLVLPEAVRKQVEDARAAVDQLLVVATLSLASALVALGMGIAGVLPFPVWLSSAVGAALLGWLTYRSAVRAAVTFGNLVRASFDLHRRDLLARLGLAAPPTLAEERELWKALAQQLYRRGADRPELIRFTTGTEQG